MATDEDKVKITSLITEALTAWCQKDFKFKNEVTVEGLLGITLDSKDIFLVNIKEIIRPWELSNGVYFEKPSDSEKPPEILNRPQSIFPQRRKKRKSTAVSKRKISYHGAESQHATDVMFHDVKSAPCDITSNYSPNSSPFFCEDLTQRQNTTQTVSVSIPSSTSDKPFMDTLFDHSSRELSSVSDIINHSGTEKQLVHAGDLIGSSELVTGDSIGSSKLVTGHSIGSSKLVTGDSIGSSKLVTGDSIGSSKLVTGDSIGSSKLGTDLLSFLPVSADWNMDVPLNLADEKPVKSREQARFTCSSCGKNYKFEQSFKKHRCKCSRHSEPRSMAHDVTTTSQPLDLSVTLNNNPDDLDPAGFSLDMQLDLENELTFDERWLSEQYTCTCGRIFTDDAVYEDHIRRCQKAKLTPYKACEICGKTFFSNSGYVKHKRLHEGSYKFRCDVCHKGFFDRTHLRAHVDSSHSKVRRYQCKHCRKSFFWKHHLKRHLGTCGKARDTAEEAAAAAALTSQPGVAALADISTMDDATELTSQAGSVAAALADIGSPLEDADVTSPLGMTDAVGSPIDDVDLGLQLNHDSDGLT